MRIPDAIIDEVRARVSIAEVVGRYVTLTRSGTSLKGLCPFHNEKTPSFHVNEDRGTWHCFGSCNEGGNVFTFLVKKENRSFPEVVEDLAATVGVEIPKVPLTPQEQKAKSETEEMFLANERAKGFFRTTLASNLPLARQAREYLKKRGMTADLIDEFGLGLCAPGWDGLARWWVGQRLHPGAGIKAGLFVTRRSGEGHYDRFHERLTFPVTNARGRVIGFGGRALEGAQTQGDESPKYLNSSESPVYKKSEALYGLDTARQAIGKAERVIIVEGYFDLLGLAAYGIREVVATCGTALTPAHLTVLRRYGPRAVVLLYDGDSAGRNAAQRALPLFLEAGIAARYCPLPDGEDPDTFVAKIGEDEFRKRLDRAESLAEFFVANVRKNGAGKSVAERAALLKRVAPVFSKVADPVEMADYGHQLADALELDEGTVLGQLAGKPPAKPAESQGFRKDGPHFKRPWTPDFRRAGGPAGRPGFGATPAPTGELPPGSNLKARAVAERNSEETILRLMLGSRNVADRVRADRIPDLFKDARLRSLGEHLAEAVVRAPAKTDGDTPSDQPDVAAVLDRIRDSVDPAEYRLITRLSVDPLTLDPESSVKELDACRSRLERRTLTDRKKTLKNEIAAAERAKDLSRVQTLLDESREIDRRLARK